MVDLSSIRRAPIGAVPVSASADAAVVIEPLPPACRWIVRGRPGTAEAAASALGFPLPTEVCRAATGGDIVALWLGPDEWLVIAPAGDGQSLGAALEAALSGVPHSVVDVGHRNTGFTVRGPKAAYVLNHGCPLDLDPAAFPVGMCTRTVLSRIEVVLWRTALDAFRLECWRTFAPYALAFLDEARREFR